MNLDSLLVCRDSATLRTLRQVLEENNFGIRLFSESAAALKAVGETRFDAVVVDCGVEGAGEVLKQLRSSRPNRNTIAFAISDGATPVAGTVQAGAHFVLRKPVSAEWMARNLRAALGPMLGERRRYFRHKLEVPVVLIDGGKEILANTSNLSEGGMAVHTRGHGNPPAVVNFKFELPGTGRSISGKGEVVWADAQGMAGIRFRTLAEGCQAVLEQWLNSRPPQKSF
ncbi:MAG TPA: response regulator [Terriglobales bacterium]|nr:response regulator [Terriglobales bacterium]